MDRKYRSRRQGPMDPEYNWSGRLHSSYAERAPRSLRHHMPTFCKKFVDGTIASLPLDCCWTWAETWLWGCSMDLCGRLPYLNDVASLNPQN